MGKSTSTRKIIERYRIPPKAKTVDLDRFDSRDKDCFPDREAAEASAAADITRLDALQDILYAESKRALLIVLQATDTGGKDSTIRKVFSQVDPLGIEATSFKKPTPEELAHDYLWRVHQAVPAKGMIGIFNRSHFEDVLVVRVHGLAPMDQIEQRYDQINAFENLLASNGVTILKFYLHISKKEQKERLQARLDDPTKHWKFNPGDLEERKLWDDYRKAYELALARCSTEAAPWFVIPADRKWYRNAIIARIVCHTLEEMNPRYPEPPAGLEDITIDD
jgi:PPK2 family polyphosphate:nucleotide phosphotransferase